MYMSLLGLTGVLTCSGHKGLMNKNQFLTIQEVDEFTIQEQQSLFFGRILWHACCPLLLTSQTSPVCVGRVGQGTGVITHLFL